MDIAAMVPTGVATSVATSPAMSVRSRLSIHTGSAVSSEYHRVEICSGGKLSNLLSLNDAGMTTRIGSSRKAKTAAQKTAAVRLTSTCPGGREQSVEAHYAVGDEEQHAHQDEHDDCGGRGV